VITPNDAQRVIAAAEAKAREIGRKTGDAMIEKGEKLKQASK